jgi:predicted AAA+ superfamily ATPase
MYIRRTIETELLSLLKEYRVVTINGPRQSGKTTLARKACPDYNYCNLEDPETRLLASTDLKAFFNRFKAPLIIDEIQRVPDLLSMIQVIVDENPEPGSFILTGSEQQSLRKAVAQSLVGRTALLTLLPLSIEELISHGINPERDEIILKGFLPAIHAQSLNPVKANRNYFQTYIDRDLISMIKVRDLSLFERFVRLLAGRIGQLLNLYSLSNDLGVSSTTLAEWLSVLEASWIVLRLPPWSGNVNKRLIKSPKIYFTDVGLAAYLLGIENTGQAARDPLIGGLFENMIVVEALKARLNQGLDPELYFYRDSSQNEVDIVFKKDRDLIPIEIKSAMTYHEGLLKSIRFFQRTIAQSRKGYLIYGGDSSFETDCCKIINYRKTSSIFI